MKKLSLPILAFFGFCLIINAQEFQGKAIYQSKSTIDVNLDGRQISEEQKQRIQQRLKSFGEQSFELNFNRTASMYVREEKLEAPHLQVLPEVEEAFVLLVLLVQAMANYIKIYKTRAMLTKQSCLERFF